MAKRLIYALAALGFALIIVGGSYYEISDLVERQPAIDQQALTEQGWWNGQNTREVSAFLKEQSKVRRHITPFYNELLFHVTGTSSTHVVAGDGFLFLRPRVTPRDSAFWKQQAEFTIETCDKINQAMATWGGKLVLLVVPDRIRAYPERLSSFDLEGSPKAPYYDNLQTGLRAKGVLSIDFLKSIRDFQHRYGESELLYRTNDHHWNTRGARLAVDEVVELIQRELPQKDTGLELSIREIEQSYNEGLLLAMGWRKNSDLWHRYYDKRTADRVESQEGHHYAAPWDEEIAVVADSFGLFDIGEQAAARLKAPISTLSQAGKGSGPAMAQLMEQLKQGWRPRMIIWIMEEKGTYGLGSPLQGWTPAATLSIPKTGKTAVNLSRQSIRTSNGLELIGDDQEFQMTFGLSHGLLFIPRTALLSSEISFYMKPIKRGLGRPFISITEENRRPDRRLNPYPGRAAIPNHDGEWHFVAMKAPDGPRNLDMLFALRGTRPNYFLRDLSCWLPANEVDRHLYPEVSQVRPWQVGSVSQRHIAEQDQFVPATNPPPPAELKVGLEHCKIWWMLRTGELYAKQPTPSQGTIKILLGAASLPGADVPEELLRLPIVASVYLMNGNGEPSRRMIHQQEFLLKNGSLQWRTVMLPLDLDKREEWTLSVRFYIPAALRDKAIGGFGSAR